MQEDFKLVYDLRFSKAGIEASMTDDVPSLKQHKRWFSKHYHEYYIIDDIGYLRKDSSDFISIMISEKNTNKGIGSEIIKNTTGKAIIKLNNSRSLKVFIRSGYKIKGFYLEKGDE